MIMSRPARLLECLVSSCISLLLIPEIKVVSIKKMDNLKRLSSMPAISISDGTPTDLSLTNGLIDRQTDRQTDEERL